jgi:hypothetical protein
MFGAGAAGKRAGQQWREAQEQELLSWGPRKLLEEPEAWDPQSGAARQVREDQATPNPHKPGTREHIIWAAHYGATLLDEEG